MLQYTADTDVLFCYYHIALISAILILTLQVWSILYILKQINVVILCVFSDCALRPRFSCPHHLQSAAVAHLCDAG